MKTISMKSGTHESGAVNTTPAMPEHTIGKHDHPEPHTMRWSDLELAAIKSYAESYALATLQAQPAAEVSDDDLQAIDDAHNWQTLKGRMAAYRAILALRPQAVPMTDAARDVMAERQRQISTEGWTPEHDDEHGLGEMARAAASYALDAASQMSEHPGVSRSLASSAIGVWTWSLEWHKPTNERRDLIKAGALILAEIERLDRASGITAPAGGEG